MADVIATAADCARCGHPASSHDCGGTECWIDVVTDEELHDDTPTRCRCTWYEEHITDPDKCICTWHHQNAGGGYWETVLEPDPDCPEHGAGLREVNG
jgi:hypothetical protein